MATCRIYLLTYRRHALLPRALRSLLSQTFTDWVCELHNDDPTDPFPQQLVDQIGDRRITVIKHPQNYGATRTFNLVFQPVAEPFVSLLEDDNWWEPTFLEMMVATLQRFPDVQVAWANMQFWQEEADGRWTNTQQTIWEREDSDRPELFTWGQSQQIFGALHSNGAMMVRSSNAHRYSVPTETPFEAMEATRERAFPFPILFIPRVLANFAVTRTSARSDRHATWTQLQTLFAGSFLRHVPLSPAQIQALWAFARSKPAKSTATLFFAAIACPGCLYLLKYAAIADWLFFSAFCVKHPVMLLNACRAIATYPTLWQFLDEQTAARTREAQLTYG
ncbi:MAG TPA: glycosyltransferase [Crinalium sp.]